MQTFLSVSCVALLLGLTDALLTPQEEASATTSTFPTFVYSPQGSPFPDTPFTNEFTYLNFDEEKPEDVATRQIIHDAFSEWAQVIQKAVQSLADPNDNTYSKWFPDTVDDAGGKKARDYITDVFDGLVDSMADPAEPQNGVALTVCDNVDFGGPTGKGLCADDPRLPHTLTLDPTNSTSVPKA